MIKIQSRSDDSGYDRPVFVCDVSGHPIANVRLGVAAFRSQGQPDGTLQDVMHAHKGACHDLAEKKLGEYPGGPWQELTDHLNELAIGMGVTILDMIKR
jgi:hypothetical protein